MLKALGVEEEPDIEVKKESRKMKYHKKCSNPITNNSNYVG